MYRWARSWKSEGTDLQVHTRTFGLRLFVISPSIFYKKLIFSSLLCICIVAAILIRAAEDRKVSSMIKLHQTLLNRAG